MTSERSAHPVQPSWRIGLWLAIFAALLVPLLAMQITNEIAWTASDFVAAAVLLIPAGIAFEIIARLPLSALARVGLSMAAAGAAALMWAHGAVGVF